MSDPRPAFDPSAVRAVAFDGYGTLFEWDFRACLAEALREQGIDADFEALARTFERAWADVSPWAEHRDAEGKVDRAHMLGGPVPDWITTTEMWRRQFERTFEAHDIAGGDAEVAATRFAEVLSVAPAYPDAHETIDALDAAGYRLGLLSNADEHFLQAAISHSRLRFSVIQSSESLRVYKPNRAAFDEMCWRLGCEPHEVLYVGDSPNADVAGGQHAGLPVAWIDRSDGHPYPEGFPQPNLAVRSLHGVATALGVAVPAGTAAS